MIVRKRINTNDITNFLVCSVWKEFFLIANTNKQEPELNIEKYKFHSEYKVLMGFDKSE